MSRKKPQLILAGIYLPLIFLLGIFFWWKINSQPVDSKSQERTVFTIYKGDGINEISRSLKERRLIRSPLFFKVLIVRLKLAKKIQAGSYYLSSSMTPREIAEILTKGNNDQWVTIIEGLRQEEIAMLLINEGIDIKPNDWVKEINLKESEGRLFPDSYLFPKNATQGAILRIIQRNFQKRVEDGLREEISKSTLTLNQILILASIVEKEAKNNEDRLLVAGILLKRLANNWPLQVDATIQYIVDSRMCTVGKVCDWWPSKLTKDDLRLKSPYNTYLYRGLPPSPICNPAISAIKAVLAPKTSDFWYYLSDPKGGMHYAKSSQEHEENIRKYLN